MQRLSIGSPGSRPSLDAAPAAAADEADEKATGKAARAAAPDKSIHLVPLLTLLCFLVLFLFSHDPASSPAIAGKQPAKPSPCSLSLSFAGPAPNAAREPVQIRRRSWPSPPAPSRPQVGDKTRDEPRSLRLPPIPHLFRRLIFSLSHLFVPAAETTPSVARGGAHERVKADPTPRRGRRLGAPRR
uniref:Predicted protein n=1 Tax=Hordeum vulgare subsp. vulgare TaxID=112509 RepID=F2DPK5_HORVV|nr:predicted protein [Hordeum vulgare subsp. vulgare]